MTSSGAWELVYYETAAGRCPVREFLDDLPAEQAERVVRKLDLLEALGTRLDPPHVRPLRGRIWELRVTGKIHHRVLDAAVVGRRIVLLHAFTAFTKKVQRSSGLHRARSTWQRPGWPTIWRGAGHEAPPLRGRAGAPRSRVP